ncbi:MAG: pyrroline-5-carboxylate reductase [Bacteroidales bacterium]|nr:pyrroline-5-carboxylate reductase [Bacteroidales bacterium]
MKIFKIKLSTLMLVIVAIINATPVLASCGNTNATTNNGNSQSDKPQRGKGGKPGGPQLGTPGGGPVIDKSGDETLQAMIKAEVPQFKQFEYSDVASGKTINYSLFTPKNIDKAKKYPLILFMADASTPGTDDVTRPLTQGYGALVWATDEWQKGNPCYVLVPQYSGVAVNDAYEHTDEVDMVARLVKEISQNPTIDSNRLYTTGQSMGGMISMYYNSAYPDLFAASIFVDCHWDSATFPELVKHKFAFITAGKAGTFDALEQAADNAGVKYEYVEFSAKLPQSEQDKIAANLLAKGAPINIINFESKTVLPTDGKGSEHMYSFDYAYRLTPVREWLFRQSK